MDNRTQTTQQQQQQQQQQTSRSSPQIVNLGGPNATSSTEANAPPTTDSSSAVSASGSGSSSSNSNSKRNSGKNKNNNGHQRSHSITNAAATSFVNMFDVFTARVSTAGSIAINSSSISNAMERSYSAASTPSSTHSGIGGIGAGSIASLTSMGSLGTTANAFYSSIGSALNSITSPITAAAAAATATTTEAVVAAASAITNHLSSPTSGTPPHGLGLNDEDCDDNDEEDEDDAVDNDGHIAAPTPSKSWSEIKGFVQEIRKDLSNLSTMVPTNVQFRHLSDGRARCYFLSTPPQTWEPTLLFTDINLRQHDDQQLRLQKIGGVGGGGGGGIDLESANVGSPNSGGGASSPTINLPTFHFGVQPKSRLAWQPLLQQPIPSSHVGSGVGGSSGSACPYAREFQLLQERKRLPTWGITSYELHKPSGKLVFPCFNDLYQCLDTGYNSGLLFPTQLRTCPEWSALDPQICPQNSDLIAYISDCDIWVTHTLSGNEKRLTYTRSGRRTYADDALSAGVPSYVMQEEFSRYQGYWWQPHSDDGIFRIVYEEVDETDVSLYTFPSSTAVPGEVDEYRFPRSGTPNAKSKLKLVQFVLNEALQISEVSIKDLPYSMLAVFPWLEYIVRVGWTPDAKYVWLQGLDRKQQRLDVMLIPLDNFCESYSSQVSTPTDSIGDHSWRSPYNRTISPLQVIYTEQSESWINVHDMLYFLEMSDMNDMSVTYVWASEETGFRHLYLVTSSLLLNHVNGCQTDATAAAAAVQQHPSFVEAAALQPRIVNKVALTSGEWEVLARNLWVDKANQLVYFVGLRDTPLEKHLYVVSLRRPEHIRLLTEPGYSYLVEFDDQCQLMLLVYCNIQRLPSCKVMRVAQTCQNGGVNGIQISLVGFLHEGGKPEPQYCPQIFRPQLPSGDIVYAMVFKPHNFQLGVKYPTVLNVYGGPEVQTVNNTFKGKHQLRMHMLAAQGYCVICIDSRGSRHRGIRFESHIRGRMGQVELTDQVDSLRILSDQLGYIDMERVAIHGWSYGGYLSLMGLVQYPEIFKVAIAGAPVTNWEFYDTGYTERYMDLPQFNEAGYTAGSVLNYVHAFPEEDNRLLLIHGLIDENVHFYHTSRLISALNKANKPYALHLFPEERHSLRNLESNKNYETKLLSFLQNL
ncbi:dipeptidyl peptidase 9 [Drosophila grimshawi]|uniref:GH15202 n=1 Tax=Drosophila grimshawi TaxID=7222 RepID=B4JUR4_DROGR|nr:dipeptidyl peptidase 9 [Drosophila grimshawi]EDV91234.1 GH15202 [Drosophila grimshawi]